MHIYHHFSRFLRVGTEHLKDMLTEFHSRNPAVKSTVGQEKNGKRKGLADDASDDARQQPQDPVFSVGDVVLARSSDGRWWDATVVKVQHTSTRNKYKVRWHAYNDWYDEWLEPERLEHAFGTDQRFQLPGGNASLSSSAKRVESGVTLEKHSSNVDSQASNAMVEEGEMVTNLGSRCMKGHPLVTKGQKDKRGKCSLCEVLPKVVVCRKCHGMGICQRCADDIKKLKPGTQVEVYWTCEETYFPAAIKSQPSEFTFNIEYDDGDNRQFTKLWVGDLNAPKPKDDGRLAWRLLKQTARSNSTRSSGAAPSPLRQEKGVVPTPSRRTRDDGSNTSKKRVPTRRKKKSKPKKKAKVATRLRETADLTFEDDTTDDDSDMVPLVKKKNISLKVIKDRKGTQNDDSLKVVSHVMKEKKRRGSLLRTTSSGQLDNKMESAVVRVIKKNRDRIHERTLTVKFVQTQVERDLGLELGTFNFRLAAIHDTIVGWIGANLPHIKPDFLHDFGGGTKVSNQKRKKKFRNQTSRRERTVKANCPTKKTEIVDLTSDVEPLFEIESQDEDDEKKTSMEENEDNMGMERRAINLSSSSSDSEAQKQQKLPQKQRLQQRLTSQQPLNLFETNQRVSPLPSTGPVGKRRVPTSGHPRSSSSSTTLAEVKSQSISSCAPELQEDPQELEREGELLFSVMKIWNSNINERVYQASVETQSSEGKVTEKARQGRKMIWNTHKMRNMIQSIWDSRRRQYDLPCRAEPEYEPKGHVRCEICNIWVRNGDRSWKEHCSAPFHQAQLKKYLPN
uniref:Tudor domain-containing protein n=3 Tax=Lotharella globosa TaxID=91324 RepID=A0A7S3Z5Q0_9EUKA|mmetsp:Transcript_16835/g.31889  ORF Transcript_16835/g.31889 Transcript_16835/m.31889 type:complete len:791 (+) Transcript_16835:265-2637(+)